MADRQLAQMITESPGRNRKLLFAVAEENPEWADVMNWHHDVIDRLTDTDVLMVLRQSIEEEVRPPQHWNPAHATLR